MPRIYGISRSEDFDYTLESQRDDPQGDRQVFKLRTLTGGERHAINVAIADSVQHKVGDRDGTATATGGSAVSAMLKACELGLVGWDNLTDEGGSVIKFPGRGRRAVDMLPTSVCQEIGRVVLERSKLTEEQRKN